MEATRFDRATRVLAGTDRRRVLGSLLGLVLATSAGSSAAKKNHKQKHGKNAPRGADTCQDNRRRGEACEQACQCKGNYRCGAPRPTQAERDTCGQNLESKEVCCAGKGDSCGTNDCECCGGMFCRNGRCTQCTSATDCPTPADPCRAAACTNGSCVPVAKPGCINCTGPEQCPLPADPCQVVACINGVCGARSGDGGTCGGPNACSTPVTTCNTANCGPAGSPCLCLPRVGSPGTVCVLPLPPEPCLDRTTGGCRTPGEICVDYNVCGQGHVCMTPCVRPR
jgi:hypothetical protein